VTIYQGHLFQFAGSTVIADCKLPNTNALLAGEISMSGINQFENEQSTAQFRFSVKEQNERLVCL
jgi:hypothetical protein